MTLMEDINRERVEFFRRAQVKFWKECLRRGSWPGVRSFSEVYEMVLGIERSDYAKLRAEVEMGEFREDYYRKLAKALDDAQRYARENLPERKRGKSFGWIARMKIRWVKSSVQIHYQKALVERDDFSRSELPAHVLLNRAFDGFRNKLLSLGHGRLLHEMERELPKLRKES